MFAGPFLLATKAPALLQTVSVAAEIRPIPVFAHLPKVLLEVPKARLDFVVRPVLGIGLGLKKLPFLLPMFVRAGEPFDAAELVDAVPAVHPLLLGHLPDERDEVPFAGAELVVISVEEFG